MQIYYICHTLPAWLQDHRRFRMGQESLLFLYVHCQLRMNWTSTDDYGFCSGKIWQRPCSAIPAFHGNIPLHHKFPLHSAKVFFPYEDVLFGNLLHKGFWGPVTFFWQGVQHFSHIILVVIEDEYTHLLLETAIISTRFLFIDVTECICTLCLYSCMYSVCRCVCVLLCVYVIRSFTYVLRVVIYTSL